MVGMAWDIFFLLLGPTLAIAALLLTRRLVTRNWQFGFRGLLMLLTLVAVSMAAIAVIVKAK
jgi:hypothetical protein